MSISASPPVLRTEYRGDIGSSLLLVDEFLFTWCRVALDADVMSLYASSRWLSTELRPGRTGPLSSSFV